MLIIDRENMTESSLRTDVRTEYNLNGIIDFKNRISKSVFEDCIGTFSDGSLNIKYTLTVLKQLLSSDIKIIDMLLETENSIDTLLQLDDDKTMVIMNNRHDFERLEREGILSRDIYDRETSDSDGEPSYNRLSSILSLNMSPNENDSSNSEDFSEERYISNTFHDVDNKVALAHRILKHEDDED